MIFPGMDPYLEDPVGWQGVHNSLVVYMRELLAPQIRPRYVARVDARTNLQLTQGEDRRPDVALRRAPNPSSPRATLAVLPCQTPERVRVADPDLNESFIEIRDRKSGMAVVTVIELLSPTNKYAGPGRDLYVAKQTATLRSTASLVEIDLLRAGPPVAAVPEYLARSLGDYHYLVSVNRAAGDRDEFEVYRIHLRERLPVVGIPLADGDPDAALDLQAALQRTYDSGECDDLPYDRPCRPPLSPEDQAWADELIRAASSNASAERREPGSQ